jgi:ferritin-like protein
MSEQPKCEACGEPMQPGEEMFKFHGYSGDCPKPPLPRAPTELELLRAENAALRAAIEPFAKIVRDSSGRIPTERLSLANWHALVKAVTPNKD